MANYSEISYLFSYLEEQEIEREEIDLDNNLNENCKVIPGTFSGFSPPTRKSESKDSEISANSQNSSNSSSSSSRNAMSVCGKEGEENMKITKKNKSPKKIKTKKSVTYIRGFAIESMQQLILIAKKNHTSVVRNPMSNQVIPHRTIVRAKKMIRLLEVNKRIDPIEDEDPLSWTLEKVKKKDPNLSKEENEKSIAQKIKSISFSLFQAFYSKASLEIPSDCLLEVPLKELKTLAKDCKQFYLRNFTNDQKKQLCPETYGNAFVDPPYWDHDPVSWRFYILNNIYYICGGYNPRAPDNLVKMAMYVYVAAFGNVCGEVARRYADSFCFDVNPIGTRSASNNSNNNSPNNNSNSNNNSDRNNNALANAPPLDEVDTSSGPPGLPGSSSAPEVVESNSSSGNMNDGNANVTTNNSSNSSSGLFSELVVVGGRSVSSPISGFSNNRNINDVLNSSVESVDMTPAENNNNNTTNSNNNSNVRNNSNVNFDRFNRNSASTSSSNTANSRNNNMDTRTSGRSETLPRQRSNETRRNRGGTDEVAIDMTGYGNSNSNSRGNRGNSTDTDVSMGGVNDTAQSIVVEEGRSSPDDGVNVDVVMEMTNFGV